jgi:GNAT superfamily N-acetyltransferase
MPAPEVAPLRLEPAGPADVPLILSFIRELAEYERMLDRVVATEELLREQLFGERPGAEVVIARWEGEPVGFALFFHNFSTFLGRRGLYLEDLFVRPAHRDKGVGRALLAQLAKTAADRGCGRLEWAVLDWNEPAIGFYRALGAEPMSDWTVYRLAGAPLAALARSPAPDATRL